MTKALQIILDKGKPTERRAEAWQYDADKGFVIGVTLPWQSGGKVYQVSPSRLAVECKGGKDFCDHGDWIIRDQDGSFWPCDNNVFLEIIELVSDQNEDETETVQHSFRINTSQIVQEAVDKFNEKVGVLVPQEEMKALIDDALRNLSLYIMLVPEEIAPEMADQLMQMTAEVLEQSINNTGEVKVN